MKWFLMEYGLRFKPEIGKDRRGVTGVKKEDLKGIGKKLHNYQKILIFTKL